MLMAPRSIGTAMSKRLMVYCNNDFSPSVASATFTGVCTTYI